MHVSSCDVFQRLGDLNEISTSHSYRWAHVQRRPSTSSMMRNASLTFINKLLLISGHRPCEGWGVELLADLELVSICSTNGCLSDPRAPLLQRKHLGRVSGLDRIRWCCGRPHQIALPTHRTARVSASCPHGRFPRRYRHLVEKSWVYQFTRCLVESLQERALLHARCTYCRSVGAFEQVKILIHHGQVYFDLIASFSEL